MEYCLVYLNGPNAGRSVALDRLAGSVTIGRDASRDVPIDDPQASRLHARLVFDGHAWKLEDCDSRNGTQVNGQPIERTTLAPGDLVRIGDRLLSMAGQQTSRAGYDLPAAAIAKSTLVARIANPQPDLEWASGGTDEVAVRRERRLSCLIRLAGELPQRQDAAALAALVGERLAEALPAERVELWLAGADSRLQRTGGHTDKSANDEDSMGDPADDDPSDLQALAALARENNEALLVDLSPATAPSSAAGEPASVRAGRALAAPVAGASGPWGAIVCATTSDANRFEHDDLQLVVAVAHLTSGALENLRHRQQLEQANEQLRARLAGDCRLIGESRPIRELLDQVARVAPTNSTVLVLGESGTGKELVAQTLHELSARAAGPFVAVNCAAFSESLLESELFGHEAGAFTDARRRHLGQFERADHGTIFLDEIGELSVACQAKLLRILEGHPFERLGSSESIRVDVRVVAATHRDLARWVGEGRFREDLFYRLRVIELVAPPLRERGDDIVQLAAYFLQHFHRRLGRGPDRISPAAIAVIKAHEWPGNVRELKNAIERAAVLGPGDELQPADLGLAAIGSSPPMESSPSLSLDEAQRRHILRVLESVGGNKTKACKILGIGRATLYSKLQEDADAEPSRP